MDYVAAEIDPTTFDFTYFNSCIPAFLSGPTSSTTIEAGLPFSANYVPTFDYDKNTVSFAVNVNATQNTKLAAGLSGGAIAGIIIGCVVGVAAISFIAFKCMKKN
jgi:Na+/H+ antiporter NhaA